MASAEPVLRVAYDTPEAFQKEHQSNLAHGGVFVPTRELFALRDPVHVEVALEFCGISVRLPAEVVHIVPPEMAETGAEPGVAVQFRGARAVIAEQLQPLVAAAGEAASEPEAPKPELGRRNAPRVRARIPVRVECDGEVLHAFSRDISSSGVMVSIVSGHVPVGSQVRLTLDHPDTGELFEVAAFVAREIETGEDVIALGMQFQPEEGTQADLEHFISEIQSAQHTRRLGGIGGPIDDLGPQAVLQMFGMSAPAGTITFRRREEEAVIGFESGLIRFVSLGTWTGMKALLRILCWRDGTFEFHARLDEFHGATKAPLPLEAALLDALRQQDELATLDLGRIPTDARVVVAGDLAALGGGPPSKTTEAVLDLAEAGFTVGRIVDVIPDTDLEVYRALGELADAGVVTFDT
jgi:Tfp pilus assembly protein PilZ